MTVRVQVSVNPDVCTSNGMCAQIAANLFTLPDPYEPAVVMQTLIDDADLIALARQAEMTCPTAAIRVEPERT